MNGCVTVVLAAWLLALAAKAGYSSWEARGSKEKIVKRHVTSWRRLIVGRKPSLGVDGAQVVILEFSDYQCPFCRAEEPLLQELVAIHPGHIAVYRYDLPLEDIHPYSRIAAVAAGCAAIQGVTEAYQAQLFNDQAKLSALSWVDLAKHTGVRDIDAFSSCIVDQKPLDAINRDRILSKTLAISSTPTFIINGSMVAGAVGKDAWHRLYDEASSAGGI